VHIIGAERLVRGRSLGIPARSTALVAKEMFTRMEEVWRNAIINGACCRVTAVAVLYCLVRRNNCDGKFSDPNQSLAPAANGYKGRSS
jgi:hypothetical protein